MLARSACGCGIAAADRPRPWAHLGAPWRGDTVAAMGFVKQSLAVRSFLVVVGCLCEGDWEGESCFVFPPKGCRASVAGFQGAQSRAPLDLLGWFFFRNVSSSFFRERLFLLPRAICYPQASEKNGGACTMTYSGREEERAPSIYRAGAFGTQRPWRGCAVPKLS
jgi:hypothetical protein